MLNYFLKNQNQNIIMGLLSLAIPMIFSEISSIIMMVTDRYFLSILGANYLAAVSVSSFALYAIFLVFWGAMCMYTNALVSQYFGAKQFERCSLVVSQGIALAFVGYIITLLLVYLFHDFIFILGNQEENILVLEKEYFNIISKASIFFLLQGVLSSFFIATGKSYLVLICVLIGAILNIPLDYILIFGKFGLPGLGVAGSAYATLISSIITFGLLSILYLGKSHKKFRVFNNLCINLEILKKLLKFGLPSAIEKFISMATYNLFMQMIMSYSCDIAAAISIAYTWNVIIYVPLLGLGEAVVSLVGCSLGNKDKISARGVTRAGFKLSVIYFFMVFTVFLFLNEWIIGLFIHVNDIHGDTNIIATTRTFIKIMIVAFGFESLLMVLDGTLRGAGDTKWVMCTTSLICITFLVLEYLVIKVFSVNYLFSYVGIILLDCSLFLFFLKRYLGTAWPETKMISNKI